LHFNCLLYEQMSISAGGSRQNAPVAEGRSMHQALLVLLVLLLSLLATATATGQGAPSHRFYGLKGDITIDGQPIEPGETITAWHQDREIGRTTVLADGSWVIDVQVERFADRCSVRFSVQSVVGTHSWTNCNLRVKMAFEDGKQVEPDNPPVEDEDDPTEPVDDGEQPVDPEVEPDEPPVEDQAAPEDDQPTEDDEDDEPDQPVDEEVAPDENPAAPEDDQPIEDDEQSLDDGEAAETDVPVQPERATPKAPKTGSGGVLDHGRDGASVVWAAGAAGAVGAAAFCALCLAYRRRRSQGM
jgi:hypothetical protein